MITYSYLNISAETFLAVSQADAEGWLADDKEGRTWRQIRDNGYRFVCIHDGKAIFEREYKDQHQPK